MEFIVFGEDGQPLPNAIVAISNLNSADSITQMPDSIRPDCKVPTAIRFNEVLQFIISDSQGIARFDGIYCDKGAQGSFRFAFLAVTGYQASSSSSSYSSQQQQQSSNNSTTAENEEREK